MADTMPDPKAARSVTGYLDALSPVNEAIVLDGTEFKTVGDFLLASAFYAESLTERVHVRISFEVLATEPVPRADFNHGLASA